MYIVSTGQNFQDYSLISGLSDKIDSMSENFIKFVHFCSVKASPTTQCCMMPSLCAYIVGYSKSKTQHIAINSIILFNTDKVCPNIWQLSPTTQLGITSELLRINVILREPIGYYSHLRNIINTVHSYVQNFDRYYIFSPTRWSIMK